MGEGETGPSQRAGDRNVDRVSASQNAAGVVAVPPMPPMRPRASYADQSLLRRKELRDGYSQDSREGGALYAHWPPRAIAALGLLLIGVDKPVPCMRGRIPFACVDDRATETLNPFCFRERGHAYGHRMPLHTHLPFGSRMEDHETWRFTERTDPLARCWTGTPHVFVVSVPKDSVCLAHISDLTRGWVNQPIDVEDTQNHNLSMQNSRMESIFVSIDLSLLVCSP